VIFAQEIKSKQQVYSENIKDTPQINPKELKNKMDSIQEFKIQEVCTNPETEIVVYCGRGGLSILAVKSLQK